jgi:hypothetical protein
VEQVKNILEARGSIQCFGKTVQVSYGLIAPNDGRAQRIVTVHACYKVTRYGGS